MNPFARGRNLPWLVLQDKSGAPVALIPTEISLSGGDIFSFRHKYLPTVHVEYHCPPRFSDEIIGNIQKAAEVLFTFFGMRDFAQQAVRADARRSLGSAVPSLSTQHAPGMAADDRGVG